jgi:hypothetical protein
MAVAMRNAAGMRSAAYTLAGAGGLGRGDDEATDRSCAVDVPILGRGQPADTTVEFVEQGPRSSR